MLIVKRPVGGTMENLFRPQRVKQNDFALISLLQ